MTRTITHLYDSYDDATRAVRSLEESGIAAADISIVGTHGGAAGTADATTAEPAAGSGAGAGASVGTVLGGGAGLLAGIGALAIPGVGPVVAAGWLIATLTGAGIGAGAGGLLGSLAGAGHREEDAHVYAEGVRRGGTLVSVRVDDVRAAEVETLLNGSGRVDIAQRGTEYRTEGWQRFDETQSPRPAPPSVGASPLGGGTGLGSATAPTTTAEAIERDRLGSSMHA